MSILQQSDSKFTRVVLFGDTFFDNNKNTFILDATIDYIIGASHQPIFMGDCLTICQMYLPCLPSKWVSFCVPGAIEVSADAAWA